MCQSVYSAYYVDELCISSNLCKQDSTIFRPVLVLYVHLSLGLPNVFFSWGSATKKIAW
jgi:hypothetical protein